MAIVGHILLYQMNVYDYLQKWTFWCKKAKAKIFENNVVNGAKFFKVKIFHPLEVPLLH